MDYRIKIAMTRWFYLRKKNLKECHLVMTDLPIENQKIVVQSAKNNSEPTVPFKKTVNDVSEI